MNAEITVKTKVSLTSGKEATFTLEDGAVEIVTPVSFKTPKITLVDLRTALEDLEAAAAAHCPTRSLLSSDHPLSSQEIMEETGRRMRERDESDGD